MIVLLPMHALYLPMQFKRLVMVTQALQCLLHLSHTHYFSAI
jgi:hypothetical protein